MHNPPLNALRDHTVRIASYIPSCIMCLSLLEAARLLQEIPEDLQEPFLNQIPTHPMNACHRLCVRQTARAYVLRIPYLFPTATEAAFALLALLDRLRRVTAPALSWVAKRDQRPVTDAVSMWL
jgi:hypothetical protein